MMLQEYTKNPYEPIDRLRTSDCRGRRQLLYSMIDHVSRERPGVVNLVGPRWIGKSTMLHCLVNHGWIEPEDYPYIGQDYELDHIIFVYFDLSSVGEENDPFIALGSEIYEALFDNDDIDNDPITGLDFDSDVLGPKILEERLSLLHDAIKQLGWRIVICLDHIEKSKLLENPGNVRRLELLATQASLIITTRTPLRFVDTGLAASPLALLAKPKMMGLLSEPAAIDLLTLTEEGSQIRLEEEDIKLLIQFVGRHPFLLIQAAQEAYDILLESPGKRISINDIRARIAPSLYFIYENFWLEYSEELFHFYTSPVLEKNISGVSKEKEEQKAIRQKLQQAAFIYENPTEEWDFKFFSPLFETFVFEKVKEEQPDLILPAPSQRTTIKEMNSILILRKESNEAKVLKLLVDADGDVISKEQLEREVWGDVPVGRGLVTTIARLRSKLKEQQVIKGQIVSHRGQGYSFEWLAHS